ALLFSCNSGSGSVSTNPPSWIIGTWENTAENIEFVFTTDNMSYLYDGIVRFDLTTLKSQSGGTITVEANSDTVYHIKATGTSGGTAMTTSYKFVKTSTGVDLTITETSGVSEIALTKSGSGSVSTNPPSWLIGTWENTTRSVEFEFTADNMIYSFAGEESANLATLKSQSGVTVAAVVNSDTVYHITVTSTGTVNYKFEKTSAGVDYTTSYETIEDKMSLTKKS
ncbi:MAG: hypothetical protein B0D92_04950, partial [Spirochaeta sp. LUC14_002_19_P3]